VLACAEHAEIILTQRDSSTAREYSDDLRSPFSPRVSSPHLMSLRCCTDIIGLDCPSPIDKLNSRSSDEYDLRTRSNTLAEAIALSTPNPQKEEQVQILAVNEFDSRRLLLSLCPLSTIPSPHSDLC
jgi:hypothetical protein